MTIRTGVGSRLFVDGFNMSGSAAALTRMAADANQLDKSTIQDGGMRRLGGKRSGGIDVVSHFDDAAGGSHPVWSTLPETDRVVTWLSGATLGDFGFSTVAKQINYLPVVSQDGNLMLTTSTESTDYGVEMVRAYTAGEVNSTGAESLTGFDDSVGAATDFGLQAWLHVTGFTGTSCTVTIEDSDDDGSGDAYALVPGATFAAVTAAGAQRIQTGRTVNVKEWMRVTLAGTFSSIDLAVTVARNRTAVAF